MTKVLNRRFLFIEQKKSDLKLSVATEVIDSAILNSKELELTTKEIVICMNNAASDQVCIGREVAGHDQNLLGLDTLKQKDFSEMEGEQESFQFSSWDELFSKISSKEDQSANIRILFSIEKPNEAEVYFLRNLEK